MKKYVQKQEFYASWAQHCPTQVWFFFFFQIPKSSKKLKIIQTKIVCTLWDEVISELFLVSDEVISGLFVVSNVFVHFART